MLDEFLRFIEKHTHTHTQEKAGNKKINRNLTQTNKNIICVPVKYQMKIQIKQKIRHNWHF